MQSPVEDLYSPRGYGKVLGPALGDQMQGNFSINLWNSAFHDAFTRLCPLRSGGHECGCLPVLARMVWSVIFYFLHLSLAHSSEKHHKKKPTYIIKTFLMIAPSHVYNKLSLGRHKFYIITVLFYIITVF